MKIVKKLALVGAALLIISVALHIALAAAGVAFPVPMPVWVFLILSVLYLISGVGILLGRWLFVGLGIGAVVLCFASGFSLVPPAAMGTLMSNPLFVAMFLSNLVILALLAPSIRGSRTWH